MTMMTPLGQGGRMYPRRRRWPGVVAVLLVVALLTAAGVAVWWFVQNGDDAPDGRATASPTCRTPSPRLPKSVPPPRKVEVDVANGTEVSGLAIETADALTTRGFDVVGIGNTDRLVPDGVALIRYARPQLSASIRLASFVPGAELIEVPTLKGGAVELWIGPDFTEIATKEAAALDAVDLPAPDPICDKAR